MRPLTVTGALHASSASSRLTAGAPPPPPRPPPPTARPLQASVALAPREHDLARLGHAPPGAALLPHQVGQPAGQVAHGLPVRRDRRRLALQLGLVLLQPRRDVPRVRMRRELAPPRLARRIRALARPG